MFISRRQLKNKKPPILQDGSVCVVTVALFLLSLGFDYLVAPFAGDFFIEGETHGLN